MVACNRHCTPGGALRDGTHLHLQREAAGLNYAHERHRDHVPLGLDAVFRHRARVRLPPEDLLRVPSPKVLHVPELRHDAAKLLSDVPIWLC